MPGRRWSPFTNCTRQKRPATKPSPVRRKACPNSSRNWMSCSQADRDRTAATGVLEGMTMTHTRRDFLKTATATAALTATLRVQAKETPTMSKENFADVNGQHIFCSVHGAGKPLILLHGGVNPDSFGSNLAELAKGRQVIAVHLQAHGRTPDTDRPMRCETMGDDVAALIGHLNLGKADVMGYSLGSGVALQTAIRHPGVVDRLVLLAATMRRDGSYPEVVAAFNQLEG